MKTSVDKTFCERDEKATLHSLAHHLKTISYGLVIL